jgi:FAD:protein FMN transferase
METFSSQAMNCEILMAAEGEAERIENAFRTAQRYIDDSEERFSRFRVQSELSQLNRSQGQWFTASPELFALVKLARSYYDLTGGLFDPTILADLKRAGYDQSMELIREHGVNQEEPVQRRIKANFREVQLDDELGTIHLPPGMEIDLGGIAKGWIVERAARLLARNVQTCAVSAGGDLFLLGLPEGMDHWEIGLEDPRDPQQTLTILRVGPGAVATSSVVKRSWRQGEKLRHHLIDPRTGEPADTDWLSVTVIAQHATDAEVYAKALLIGGPTLAQEMILKRTDLSFLAVDPQGQLWGSQNQVELAYVNA